MVYWWSSYIALVREVREVTGAPSASEQVGGQRRRFEEQQRPLQLYPFLLPPSALQSAGRASP